MSCLEVEHISFVFLISVFFPFVSAWVEAHSFEIPNQELAYFFKSNNSKANWKQNVMKNDNSLFGIYKILNGQQMAFTST